jgi:hypothetical protein
MNIYFLADADADVRRKRYGNCCLTHIVLCFCFVCLSHVYPMLQVSLDYPFLIAPSIHKVTFL